jgi:hypothetical protein
MTMHRARHELDPAMDSPLLVGACRGDGWRI